MSDPHWTTYVQILGTPIIAIIAGGIASAIAYRQWQTAKAKVALDLFDKRLEAYEAVADAVHEIIQVGPGNIDVRITRRYAAGLSKAKFLFGPEVYKFLDEIWLAILKLKSNSDRQERNQSEQKLKELHDVEDTLNDRMASFHRTLDGMVVAYMRMDQKK